GGHDRIKDNCPGATYANNGPSIFPPGVTTVTWTVTDAAGNTATATQTVRVEDHQNPTITAPVNLVVNTDLNQCTASGVALGTPIIGDNCPAATYANNAPATFPPPTTHLTWTVTDAAGHHAPDRRTA